MELSTILFEEITGQKGLPLAPGSAEADRRKQHRFSFGARAMIHSVESGGEGPGAVVLLRDVSAGSIGFIHFEAIAPGNAFVIKFNGETGRTFRIQAASARCEPGGVGGKQFCVGATFEQLIEPSEETVKTIESAVHAQPAPDAAAAAETPKRNRIFAPKKVETAAAHTHVPFTPSGAAPIPAAPMAAAPVAAAPMAAAPVAAAPITPALAAPMAVTAAHIEPKPAHVEAKPVVAAAPTPVAFEPEPVDQNPVEAAETVDEPAVEPAAAVEQARPHFNLHVNAPLPENAPAEAPASAAHDTGARASTAPGHNREVVAQVKTRLLKQGQVLHGVTQQLEDARRELNVQKAQVIDLACERDQLKARLAEVESQLTEQRDDAEQQLAQMMEEMRPMKDMLAALQAKSDADDKSIAELAALLGGEAEEADGELAAEARAA